MAPKTGTKVNLSDRELQIVALAFQCFEKTPKVNFRKLAELGGYKNASVASVMWRGIFRKISQTISDDDTGSNSRSGRGSGARSKASATKGKGKRDAAPKDDEDEKSGPIIIEDEEMKEAAVEAADKEIGAAMNEKPLAISQDTASVTEMKPKDTGSAAMEFIKDSQIKDEADDGKNSPLTVQADFDDPWRYFDANHEY